MRVLGALGPGSAKISCTPSPTLTPYPSPQGLRYTHISIAATPAASPLPCGEGYGVRVRRSQQGGSRDGIHDVRKGHRDPHPQPLSTRERGAAHHPSRCVNTVATRERGGVSVEATRCVRSVLLVEDGAETLPGGEGSVRWTVPGIRAVRTSGPPRADAIRFEDRSCQTVETTVTSARRPTLFWRRRNAKTGAAAGSRSFSAPHRASVRPTRC